MTLRQFHEVTFRNSFVDELLGEDDAVNQPRQVPGACYSRVMPTPVRDPHLLAWSEDLADRLGLERPTERGASVDILGGNAVNTTMKPFAARYGGHQFGNWAGQLGDGRAISLGELAAPDGSYWEVQLKGAGPTPYSRRGDGRAVLRSSLREFLCSEAMHHLGVPTTCALSLVGTGDLVIRDMFYDGHPEEEPGAVVARIAPTFIRFGNFEIMTANGEIDNLRALADYVIRHHYPELGEPSEETYGEWFREICRRTGVMIAHWLTVGFVHGVMNTDNMSILGLTIDYGPYGWLEPYEPGWTPNTTDFGQHRYAFGRQPQVAMWNLVMLARALSPLITDTQELEGALDQYKSTLEKTLQARMLRKLGLTSLFPQEDQSLVDDLHQGLADSQMDMTLFFRQLSHVVPALKTASAEEEPVFRPLIDAVSYAPSHPQNSGTLMVWLERYALRLRQEPAGGAEIRQDMLHVNPKYVLRNYLAQKAIDAAQMGDLSYLETLMRVLKNPYDEQPEHDALAAKRPDWARDKPGCATLSCSS